MKKVEWFQETERLKAALSSSGVFLVAVDGAGKPNPMTIGWAQVGIVWSLPVMTVLVRESRYTHGCISTSDTFTVSVPKAGELRDALTLCGTKSGRDMDKAAEAGLTWTPGHAVDTPVIAGCGLYYECEIIARTQQSLASFGEGAGLVLKKYYADGDYHLVVMGQILEAYTT